MQTFQLVIIGDGQIFKSHQQNLFILGKSLLRDNRGSANFQGTSKLSYFCNNFSSWRGSSNFQMTSLNLVYFCENFISWLQGQLKFSRECIWIALLSWTRLIVIMGLVWLVIIGGGQVFKWHRVMYCVILSVIVDATPFVLKMQSYLLIFFLKVRHILFGVSGIVFACYRWNSPGSIFNPISRY